MKFLSGNCVVFCASILAILQGCASTSTSQCMSCSTSVWKDNGSGGEIWSEKSFGNFVEVKRVAEQYCSEKHLPSPTIGSPVSGNENLKYPFSCDKTQAGYGDASSKQPSPAKLITTTGISLDAAKDKCRSLGFVAGTEKFGGCVLQLSK